MCSTSRDKIGVGDSSPETVRPSRSLLKAGVMSRVWESGTACRGCRLMDRGARTPHSSWREAKMCSLDNPFTSPVFNDYKVWSRLGSSMVGACEDLKSSSVLVGVTQKVALFCGYGLP